MHAKLFIMALEVEQMDWETRRPRCINTARFTGLIISGNAYTGSVYSFLFETCLSRKIHLCHTSR